MQALRHSSRNTILNEIPQIGKKFFLTSHIATAEREDLLKLVEHKYRLPSAAFSTNESERSMVEISPEPLRIIVSIRRRFATKVKISLFALVYEAVPDLFQWRWRTFVVAQANMDRKQALLSQKRK